MGINIGDKFGLWTVIDFDEESHEKEIAEYRLNKKKPTKRWFCQCSCENKTVRSVHGASLISGKSTNCGCLRKAKIRLLDNTKRNEYDLIGEYGIGWTTNTNKEFYFDLEDYEKIKDYCWRESNWGYAIAPIANNATITMQYLIYPSEKLIDHKNRIRLDNRKENLRECTQIENLRNKSILPQNTSGIIGVYYNSTINKWTAQIGYNCKTHYIGSFLNKDDAIKARLEAEKEHYGEFAPQKNLFELFKIPKD